MYKIFGLILSSSFVFIFCTLCAISISCGSSNPNSKTGSDVPPDNCKIIGTIVAIDSSLAENDAGSPCSQVPCNALVKIDSIIGVGSNFPPLAEGKIVSIKFMFTLSPTTKDLFPNLTKRLPGLKTGSSFKGLIQKINKREDKIIPGFRATFKIYDYTVL